MEERVAIVTDSNSGLTPEQGEAMGVYVLPMPFYMEDTLHYEGVTIAAETFYTRLRAGCRVSTSQPAPGDLMALWDKVLETWDKLVYIPMTSALSGSCFCAAAAAEDYNGRVLVADNKSISLVQRQAVEEAVALRDRGVSAAEIKERLEVWAGHNRIYLGVDSLHYLRQGGRISPAEEVLGTALQIKPVLTIDTRAIQVCCKARGRKQMAQRLIAYLRADVEGPFAGRDVSLYIAYAGSPEQGEAWRQAVQDAFPDRPVGADRLPLVIACHTGPDVYGLGLAENMPLS